MERLSEEQIEKELEQLPDWKRIDDKWIGRRYRFNDYLSGVRFVDQVAEYAESRNHHPFISIDYKIVTLRISSWQMKGLTDLDFEMVNHFEELYQQTTN
ncbi:4a-hydroxytetrahydrobiopterin dehydratase [Barrientosiimonas marina]|uniref:4a-hydroxytetrahydrobiopterin dehydratase n=1 Tax=Lentibacillus kimchii TaxID=1542911 RepID=A0ABW2UTA7_9BACI